MLGKYFPNHHIELLCECAWAFREAWRLVKIEHNVNEHNQQYNQ